MPLSEQEQRLLDEMERSLYQHDADFVQTSGGQRGRPNYRFVVIGVLLGVAGIGLLVTGVVLQLLIVGVIGFAMMFAGVLVSITPSRSKSAPQVPLAKSSGSSKQASSAGFMDRLNERWDRRQDGQG